MGDTTFSTLSEFTQEWHELNMTTENLILLSMFSDAMTDDAVVTLNNITYGYLGALLMPMVFGEKPGNKKDIAQTPVASVIGSGLRGQATATNVFIQTTQIESETQPFEHIFELRGNYMAKLMRLLDTDIDAAKAMFSSWLLRYVLRAFYDTLERTRWHLLTNHSVPLYTPEARVTSEISFANALDDAQKTISLGDLTDSGNNPTTGLRQAKNWFSQQNMDIVGFFSSVRNADALVGSPFYATEYPNQAVNYNWVTQFLNEDRLPVPIGYTGHYTLPQLDVNNQPVREPFIPDNKYVMVGTNVAGVLPEETLPAVIPPRIASTVNSMALGATRVCSAVGDDSNPISIEVIDFEKMGRNSSVKVMLSTEVGRELRNLGQLVTLSAD
jgi:hypothetical protein